MVTQPLSARRCQGWDVPARVPAAPQGPLWDRPVPITYRLAFLPLRARKTHRPPWSLGMKGKSEGGCRVGSGAGEGWGHTHGIPSRAGDALGALENNSSGGECVSLPARGVGWGWDGTGTPAKAGMDSPCPVHLAWDTHTADSSDPTSYKDPMAQGQDGQRPAQGASKAGRAMGRGHYAAANPGGHPHSLAGRGIRGSRGGRGFLVSHQLQGIPAGERSIMPAPGTS